MKVKSIVIKNISPTFRDGMIFEVDITIDAWGKTLKVLEIREEEEEFIRIQTKDSADHKEYGMLFGRSQIKKIDYYSNRL